jgi:hypothetical protein
MRIVYSKIEKQGGEQPKQAKKLPMDKDPVFLANLEQQIIADHNRKVRALKIK